MVLESASSFVLQNQRVVLACLAGLIVSLLLVGLLSGTLIRHIVQVLPAIGAFLLLQRHAPRGASAAMPVFLFWTSIMILIWLYLLGMSSFAAGHYTTAEIILTGAIAVCSLVGIVFCRRTGKVLSLGERMSLFGLFVILQLGAMWISFLQPFANR